MNVLSKARASLYRLSWPQKYEGQVMPHLVELCQQSLDSLLLLRSSSSHDFLGQTGPVEGVPCREQVVLGQSGRR